MFKDALPGEGPYRAGAEAVRWRAERLHGARLRERAALSGEARDVYVRRAGRALGGLAGTAVALAAFGLVLERYFIEGQGHERDGTLTALLLCGWPAWAAGYVGGVALANLRLALRLRGAVRLPAAPLDRALAHFESSPGPVALLRAMAGPLERWSVVLPLTAMTFLTPLTLHFVVAAVAFPMSGETLTLGKFDDWMQISVFVVGHAHLATAAMAVFFARRLGRRREAVDEGVRYGFKALGVAVAVAAVPGIVFFALPPLLVALTGIAFLPAAYAWTARTLRDERMHLAVLDVVPFGTA